MTTAVSQQPDSTSVEIVHRIWKSLDLPEAALRSINLPGKGLGLPSSFKVGALAQATIALSALAAALIHAERNNTAIPRVTVPLDHACIEFQSERLYTLNAQPPNADSHPIGCLHATRNGHVRIHDGFPHHRVAALGLIGCPADATKEQIRTQLATLDAIDLETRSVKAGAIVAALRSSAQWDATPQAQAVADFPVQIRKIASGEPAVAGAGQDKCLRGLRVVEMSRVLAAPVAGRTLAAHGADVLWVTSPALPLLPALDKDVQRGKRTVQLDLNEDRDMETMRRLLGEADVFIQGYRPGSLGARGLGPEALAAASSGAIVHASLSAYGSAGPWRGRRGFDSIVQTQSGINVAEAERCGVAGVSKVLPCQALDHASGYLLAFGVMVALHRQAVDGGSYAVEVSLAGTMKYLKSLGQWEGATGFERGVYTGQGDVPDEYLETRESGFGTLRAVKHSAKIEGVEVGWEVMPKPVGSDEAAWP